MSSLQKFHCECGAPLKAQNGIIECAYCGSCYIWENNTSLEIKAHRQENNYDGRCTCNDYFMSSDGCPVHGYDYRVKSNPAPSLYEWWMDDRIKQHNTYHTDSPVNNWEYIQEEPPTKATWWDILVTSFTNTFDKIAKGIINLWQKLML